MPSDPQHDPAARGGVPDAKRAEIGLCLLLAAADGEVSDAEVGALSSRFGALLGDMVSPLVLHEVLAKEMALLDAIGPDDYMAKLADRIPPADRARALESALRVACADGLSAEERDAFREAAAALGLGDAQTTLMIARETRRPSEPAWSAAAPPALPDPASREE